MYNYLQHCDTASWCIQQKRIQLNLPFAATCLNTSRLLSFFSLLSLSLSLPVWYFWWRCYTLLSIRAIKSVLLDAEWLEGLRLLPI